MVFQAAVVLILLYGCTIWTLTKQMEKKSLTTTTIAASKMEQVMEAAPHKAATVRPLTTHHGNYQS